MSIHFRQLTKAFWFNLLVAPLLLVGTTELAIAKPKGEPKQSPATKEDIFLYRGLGSSYLCNARQAGVDFPKAVGISAATYVQVLNGRHGGLVESAGKEKLTNKQLFSGAEFQIITGALQYCPKEVPADIKKKVKAVMNKQKVNKKR